MTKTNVLKAIRLGRRQAREVIASRTDALTSRSTAIAAMPPTIAPPAAPPRLVATAGGFGSRGVLVAEGDSWFDYPGTDVLGVLEDEHGYDVESVAHKGDRVEDMAYSGGQLTKFTRTLERVIRRGTVPTAILLSGGGNDIAGDEFAVLLNHAASPVGGLDKHILEGVIDNRLFYAYLTILAAVTAVCKKKAGVEIPILVHGYDYPVADGRGFWGGWWFLPGPWLEPGFREKGFQPGGLRDAVLKALIDRFNKMLRTIVAMPEFAHVSHVDLRGLLPRTSSDYKKWWDNELHPTEKGFKKVAAQFVSQLP